MQILVTVVLTVLAFTPLINRYLHDLERTRHIRELIARVQAPNAQVITILKSLDAEDPNVRTLVLSAVREDVLKSVWTTARGDIDAKQGRCGYTEAQMLLEDTAALYADSYQLREMQDDLERWSEQAAADPLSVCNGGPTGIVSLEGTSMTVKRPTGYLRSIPESSDPFVPYLGFVLAVPSGTAVPDYPQLKLEQITDSDHPTLEKYLSEHDCDCSSALMHRRPFVVDGHPGFEFATKDTVSIGGAGIVDTTSGAHAIQLPDRDETVYQYEIAFEVEGTLYHCWMSTLQRLDASGQGEFEQFCSSVHSSAAKSPPAARS